MSWVPTAELRFVERPGPLVATDRHGAQIYQKTIKILQQKFIFSPDNPLHYVVGHNPEWRDVPLETQE